MRIILVAILSILSIAGLFAQNLEQQVRFQQVFDNIILPAISVPVPNVGQGSHTVSVFYPTAVANVLGLQIRIEASFDNSIGSYFPISEDIAVANFDGNFAYAIGKANGTFPFVRINALAVNAVLPADIWYTGSTFPIGAVVYDPGTVRYITYDSSQTINGVFVTNTVATAGQILYYDATTNTYIYTPAPAGSGQFYYWDAGTNTWMLSAAPGVGDTIIWNGAAWVPGAPVGGVSFDLITSGTNATATMVVATGATLGNNSLNANAANPVRNPVSYYFTGHYFAIPVGAGATMTEGVAVTGSGDGTLVPAIPGTAVTGDILLALFGSERATTPTMSASWTLINSVASTDNARVTAYWHLYNSAAPPNTTMTFAGTLGASSAGRINYVRGVSASPVEASGTVYSTSGLGNGSIIIPALTSAVNNTFWVTILSAPTGIGATTTMSAELDPTLNFISRVGCGGFNDECLSTWTGSRVVSGLSSVHTATHSVNEGPMGAINIAFVEVAGGGVNTTISNYVGTVVTGNVPVRYKYSIQNSSQIELANFASTGGMQLITGTRPDCSPELRGTIYYVAKAFGALDTLAVCRKAASDAFSWIDLF